MSTLQRSASGPGLSKKGSPKVSASHIATLLGLEPSTSGKGHSSKASAPWATNTTAPPTQQLCKGELFVAQPGARGNAAGWQPYMFKHQRDGGLTFKKASDPQSTAADDSRGPPTDEYLLDADWRKPFVISPWNPLARSGGAASTPSLSSSAKPSPSQTRKSSELYPFSLSYAPMPSVPGEADHTGPARRTVMLGASSLDMRKRWMSTLAQKASNPGLRGESSKALPAFPAAAIAAQAQTQMMRFGALGEKSTDLPARMQPEESSQRGRLPGGHKHIFENHSKLHIVRHLYDGYASDPLGEHERGCKLNTTVSPQVASSKKLLATYVDRQAHIEGLLEQKTGVGRVDHHMATYIAPAPAAADEDVGVSQSVDRFALSGDEIAESGAREELDPSIPPAFDTVAMTPNAKMIGNVLCNDQWSGGALLQPPNPTAFTLTIRPEDATETNPVFIGIAPVDADLSVLNFFDVGGGVFLCMGGIASTALIAALGAPGGPCFHAFGKRTVARLPVPPSGSTLTLSYHEENPSNGGPPEGHVSFLIGDENEEGTQFARPPLTQKLPGRGIWRPCVLLCMPNTRVRIEQLI